MKLRIEDWAAEEKKRDTRSRRIMMRLFAFIVVASGSAFVYKLYEFFHDLTDSDGLRFAGSHLLTYVLVAGGFGLLLCYGFLRGHFADIEKAKYEMLDLEERHDREEFASASR